MLAGTAEGDWGDPLKFKAVHKNDLIALYYKSYYYSLSATISQPKRLKHF
jgi:hypothetical protein